MTFPSVFWDETSHMIGAIGLESDDFGAGEHVIFFNLVPKLEKPGLVMFAGGDYAQTLEQMSPAEALAVGMARLRLLYGEGIPEPEQFFVSDWGTSPYTCGAYSGLGIGATDDDMRAFESVIDKRVTFAGEHTIPEYSATIHGAYISGLKAAKRIWDLI
ncbi:FAD-dependent oxidoreductase [Chloroflexi bacterium TSY]|nr:FAD-dependent oxidoreductase [Chloroflexi bacterium TSY]